MVAANVVPPGDQPKLAGRARECKTHALNRRNMLPQRSDVKREERVLGKGESFFWNERGGARKRNGKVEKGLDKDYRSAILTLVEIYPEAPAMSGVFCFLGGFGLRPGGRAGK